MSAQLAQLVSLLPGPAQPSQPKVSLSDITQTRERSSNQLFLHYPVQFRKFKLFYAHCFTLCFQPKNNFAFQIGAGEDLFSTNKSKEELYLEAKHVLNMIEPYSLKSSEINGVVPRKPPRSKPEVKSMNQESVQQRVMIGTYMIHQKNSPEHTLNKNGVTNQTTTTYGYSNNEVSFI